MAGWQVEGGRGSGRRLADVEQGWSLGHEDLQGLETELVWGANLAFQAHGANTLGVIAARDNNSGGLGLAPSIGYAYLSSENNGSPYADTANAILAALQRLEAGDVLVIESQIARGASLLPVEFDDVVFELIRLATAAGIVTVEPAGNGGQLLDEIRSPTARAAVFDRDVRDSGAVMVAAASSSVPHIAMPFTNFGSRIDCYAWGEDVVTTGGDASNSLPGAYNFSYGGTSSAAAIIAGVALQIQGIAARSSGGVLSAAELRAILSNPYLGTPSMRGAEHGIGAMPDLGEVLDDERLRERLEPKPRS